MARTRPANPSNSQRPTRLKHGVTTETHEYGDDPWANGGRVAVAQRSQAKSSRLAEVATIKQDESEEKVAIPTPIAQTCWKVISPNGHEQLCYEPIPGFEHLWSGIGPLQGTPRSAASPKSVPLQSYQTAIAQVPDQTFDGFKAQRNPRKRSRSTKLFSEAVGQVTSDEGEDGQYDRDIKITTEQSYTFYIGDIAELKKFFRRRLDELTMKPLRPIVTAWIKQLEPKRLSRYGPYHKKLPKDAEPECTPPWWPADVFYEEPSHLDKAGLLTLAVDIMLQHRVIDKEKRKGSWVAKLRQAAQYAVETTPPDQFSSSKGSGFSEKMQNRALTEILPNLFETAQLFEDHLAYHGHYEGSGIADPGRGKRVTWQPLTRPARQPVPSRKRPRKTKTSPGPRSEIDVDASGDETETDDGATSSYLCGEQPVPEQNDASNNSEPKETPQQALAYTREAVAEPLQICPCSAAATPTVSFGQSVYDLPLGEKMDLDIDTATRTSLHDHICANASHPMQYSAIHTGYNQPTLPLQQESCGFSSTSQSAFGPSSSAAYHHPFPVFDAHFAHPVGHVPFQDDICHAHGYQPYGPLSANPLNIFHETPDSASISCQAEASQY